MTSSNPINKLNRLFLREKGFMSGRDQTPEALALTSTHGKTLKIVKSIGQSENLGEIIAVERRFLENDLAEHTTSSAQRNSLKQALTELGGAEKTIPLTTDPALYKAVDISHSHSKTRSGGLPKDAARKFFLGNRTRLLNMDKARLTEGEKTLINARKENMRIAEKVYATMQRQALGLAPKEKGREQGRSR